MSVFLLAIKGQVESAAVPDCPELFLKYQIVYGDDWVVTTGIEEGITQICQRSDNKHDFVFNFPLDITLKSTNPHGWPQIIVSAYGKDSWGHEVLRGYGVTRIPVCLGSNQKKTVGLFTLEPSSTASKISGWLSGRSPELYDPRLLTRNNGREVLKTKSKGCVHLRLHVLTKDVRALGFTLGRPENEALSAISVPSQYARSDGSRTILRDDEPPPPSTSQFERGFRNQAESAGRNLPSDQELNEITPISPLDERQEIPETVVPRPRRRTRKNNEDEPTTSTS